MTVHHREKQLFHHLKKSDNKNVPLDENVDRESADSKAKVLSNMFAVEILKLVHEPAVPYCEIFTLRFYDDLKFSEIGEVFGKSENWSHMNFY